MGFWLNLYAERRTENGWAPIGPTVERTGPGYDHPVLEPMRIIDRDKDYEQSAVLMGLFGREDINPVTRRRGLPADLSDVLATWYEIEAAYEGMEGWLMLTELLEHDWDQLVEKRERVHPELVSLIPAPPQQLTKDLIRDLRAGWQPREWVDPDDYEPVQWVISHRDLISSDLLDEVVPRLLNENRASDIRLIFWF
jgi:hypothetical protein